MKRESQVYYLPPRRETRDQRGGGRQSARGASVRFPSRCRGKREWGKRKYTERRCVQIEILWLYRRKDKIKGSYRKPYHSGSNRSHMRKGPGGQGEGVSLEINQCIKRASYRRKTSTKALTQEGDHPISGKRAPVKSHECDKNVTAEILGKAYALLKGEEVGIGRSNRGHISQFFWPKWSCRVKGPVSGGTKLWPLRVGTKYRWGR